MAKCQHKIQKRETMQGKIIKTLSGFYYVKTDAGIFTCKARGIMRKTGESPLVGDMVEISVDMKDKTGVVDKILPRKNVLTRPPVANIDKAFIVSSYSTPKPNFYIIDTLIAICEYKGIEPVIVFNKADEEIDPSFAECYKKIGYKTFVTSAKLGSGIDELKSEFKGSVSVLIGNSGVGKSSLLNHFTENEVKTGEVSEKLGRGKHTTRHTEIFELSSGGAIVDTPGFSEIEAIKNDYAFKENLEFSFKEFEPHLNNCKFTGCSHTTEKGCAVLEAASKGDISESRIESYKALYNELKELKKWQLK